MRRMTAILTLSLCAVAGCQGGGAQEPYDGLMTVAPRRATAAAAPAPQAPDTEPIASAVDVPWTIALLSDPGRPAAAKRGEAASVDGASDVAATIAEEADLHVAVDPGPVDEKPASPKACSGVVKTRS
jgi:glucose/arabinose dehydrogenase